MHLKHMDLKLGYENVLNITVLILINITVIKNLSKKNNDIIHTCMAFKKIILRCVIKYIIIYYNV